MQLRHWQCRHAALPPPHLAPLLGHELHHTPLADSFEVVVLTRSSNARMRQSRQLDQAQEAGI